MITRFLLTTILKRLQEQNNSGHFSVSWMLDQDGFVLTGRDTDGIVLFNFAIPSEQVKELLSKLSSVVTEKEKP